MLPSWAHGSGSLLSTFTMARSVALHSQRLCSSYEPLAMSPHRKTQPQVQSQHLTVPIHFIDAKGDGRARAQSLETRA